MASYSKGFTFYLIIYVSDLQLLAVLSRLVKNIHLLWLIFRFSHKLIGCLRKLIFRLLSRELLGG